MLAGPLTALTPKSMVDAGPLRQRLTQIRARGWEWAVDDVSLGLTAAAVPVMNAGGDVLCAVSITGLTAQLPLRSRSAKLERLRQAAAEIRRAIPDHPASGTAAGGMAATSTTR